LRRWGKGNSSPRREENKKQQIIKGEKKEGRVEIKGGVEFFEKNMMC
jgi:hypothetical protein